MRNPKIINRPFIEVKFPPQPREILKDLQENTKIPKAVSLVAKNLLEIVDYTMAMRNHCQITGKPEALDLSDPRIKRYKEVIAQSKELANFISDSGPSNREADEHYLELLKKGVEAKEESLLQEFSDLVGEDAINFRFPEEKGSPKPQLPKGDGLKLFNSLQASKTTGTSIIPSQTLTESFGTSS